MESVLSCILDVKGCKPIVFLPTDMNIIARIEKRYPDAPIHRAGYRVNLEHPLSQALSSRGYCDILNLVANGTTLFELNKFITMCCMMGKKNFLNCAKELSELRRKTGDITSHEMLSTAHKNHIVSENRSPKIFYCSASYESIPIAVLVVHAADLETAKNSVIKYMENINEPLEDYRNEGKNIIHKEWQFNFSEPKEVVYLTDKGVDNQDMSEDEREEIMFIIGCLGFKRTDEHNPDSLCNQPKCWLRFSCCRSDHMSDYMISDF